MDELFQDQRKRNARAKALVAAGETVRRFSVRNQRLHPNYVQDAERVDNGFGNIAYDTHWPVLYGVSIRTRP